MKKRLIVMISVLLVTLVFLAACNNDGDDSEIQMDGDLMVVSIMSWDIEYSFGDEPCELYSYVQDRFGITFEIHSLGWDNFEELALLWAAADTLPDVIGGVDFLGTPTLTDWVDAGIIRPLPDDLSAYPALNLWVSQQFAQDFAIDGHIYHIPRGNTPHAEWTAQASSIISRRDWREQLGIPVPETMDDFIAMWTAFADPANDLNGDGSTIFGILPDNPRLLMDQTFAGHGDTRDTWVKLPDGSMVIPAFEPTALPLLSFFRQAFTDGLIDPDFIITGLTVSTQQFAQGRAGTLLRQAVPGHLNGLHEEFKIFNPDFDFANSIELLTPPVFPGVTPLFLMGTGHWSESYINADVPDEKLERILAFMDWQMSEEGINTIMFGFEGTDWRMENGEIIQLTDVDPDTGLHLMANNLYQFAGGGMSYFSTWSGDSIEWVNPNIPSYIRELSLEHRERILGPGMGLVPVDNRLRALNVPEAAEFGLAANDEWVAFITDASDLSDEELFEQFYARWNASGYGAAKAAMTAEVAARGY